MKPYVIAGIALAVIGAFIVFRGLSYGSERSMMRVGDVQVSAESRQIVPTWVGAVAIAGGLLLMVGMGRRRGT
jgi:drug/metabolite transporter (DMT)-like permease